MKTLRTPFVAFTAAAGLVLAGCGTSGTEAAGETVTVAHAQGDAEVPASPKRVVVLDFGALDTLAALDVDVVAGVPKRALPSHLAEFQDAKYEDVGSLTEPDMEKVAEIDPDLIVIGGRTAAKYAEFAEIAPTVDMTVESAQFLTDLKSRSESLGQIFDKSAETASELAEIDQRVLDAKATSAQAGKALIVLVSGGKLSAYGPGSRFGFVHDVVGVPAADPNLKVDSHGQAVSFEYVAQTNPDTIYVIDRDGAIGQTAEGQSAQEVLNNPLVAGTKAAKNDNIVYLDGARWYLVGAGLDNVEAMIDEVTGTDAS